MSANFSEIISVLSIVALVVILFLVTEQRDELKKQAVEKGFAEYVCDSSGKTTWQWKDSAK